ncbi:MAG: STAS domain-containing protein [Planctomycetota bacterium]
MKLAKKTKGDVAILSLAGEFDTFVCKPFMTQVESLINNGFIRIVLNLKDITFINSTGIGAIIKCRRKLMDMEGNIAISVPSIFVQNALENLGLTEVLKTFDTDEKAIEFFNPSEGIEMSDGTKVIIHLTGTDSGPIVCKIRTLEENRIVFETAGTNANLISETEVKLKFRLPLFSKSYYFDISAKIIETIHSSNGVSVTAEFSQIQDEDRNSIAQFVKDMQFLKKEAGL